MGPPTGAAASPVMALVICRMRGAPDAGRGAVVPLAARDPHVLRPDLLEGEQLKAVLARELRDLAGRDCARRSRYRIRRACGGSPFNWQRSTPPGLSTRCASRR